MTTEYRLMEGQSGLTNRLTNKLTPIYPHMCGDIINHSVIEILWKCSVTCRLHPNQMPSYSASNLYSRSLNVLLKSQLAGQS
jgi:hypothetical protein